MTRYRSLFSPWMVTVIVAAAPLVMAEEHLADITWEAFSEDAPDEVSIQSDGALRITHRSDEQLTLELAVLEAPGITEARYVVKGRIRYDGVQGEGYLEMWSQFDEGEFFTKTIADSGPMAKITGSSDWRDVALPFDASQAAAPPSRLRINLVLEGAGEVLLTPMALVQLLPDESPVQGVARGPWGISWGYIGGAFGVIAGILGALGGQGKARTLVLSGMKLIMVLAFVALVAGVVSVFRGATFDAYYPLLLLGTIGLFVPASAAPGIRKRYAQLELQKSKALDGS